MPAEFLEKLISKLYTDFWGSQADPHRQKCHQLHRTDTPVCLLLQPFWHTGSFGTFQGFWTRWCWKLFYEFVILWFSVSLFSELFSSFVFPEWIHFLSRPQLFSYIMACLRSVFFFLFLEVGAGGITLKALSRWVREIISQCCSIKRILDVQFQFDHYLAAVFWEVVAINRLQNFLINFFLYGIFLSMLTSTDLLTSIRFTQFSFFWSQPNLLASLH